MEEVGARFSGHASFFDLSCIFISADLAMEDLLLLVKEAIFLQCLLRDGSILIISSVSPEFEIKSTISFLSIRPMSP